MSNAEFQAWRDKGLFFRCDECYYVGHRCKIKEQRKLRVLVVWKNDEEVEVIEEDQEVKKDLKTPEVEAELKPVAELSLNFVVGLTNQER